MDVLDKPPIAKLYYIGRYDIVHKGLDYLCDALDRIERKHIKICIDFFGKGTEEENRYLNYRINKYNYVSARNCGEIYDDRKKEKLEQYGIMILTSRYEGFPMTVLEAWNYGNPCIVTPGTNVAKEIEDYKIGWVTSHDPEEIAKQILKAIKEYEINRTSYIQKCKNHALLYEWSKIARKSKEEFERILKNLCQ